MAHTGFISQVDTALADLIWRSIEGDSTVTAMLSNKEQISFSSPKTASTKENKKLTIFLYNIINETATKNTPAQEDASGKMNSDNFFVLHYLVTPFTGNEKDNHSLLEKLIQSILAKPLIVTSYAENNVDLLVKIDSLSTDELSRLWVALDSPLRLSISLTVSSTATLLNSPDANVRTKNTPETKAVATNQTIQLYQAVLKTFSDQSADWKNRNMVVKQWVLQDFQKNAGMTVEEMQSMLNSLGNKLSHGESTANCIKPLNQLVGYYQHQLDELKGLHKISHKQTANIDAITIWINDIKALQEALKN